MGFQLGSGSRAKLFGVKPPLKRIVARAIEITEVDFAVLEGMRTAERQQVLFDDGKSKTLNSRHLTGHAVDIGAWVDGKISWDWKHYPKIAAAMNAAADELGFDITWGGDWDGDGDTTDQDWHDGPHFELSWKMRPAGDKSKSRQSRRRTRGSKKS